MALLWASALVAEEPQSKQERDLAQCLEICSGDSICEKNCQNALGEGAVDGEEECDD